jgi:peptidyl-prolyl cis-trans isomerase A (cyclophilin A)
MLFHMKLILGFSRISALLASLVVPANARAQTLPHVLVRTSAGDITLEIDSVHAPATAANFLHYVDAGLYRGGLFHRTVTPDNQPNNAVKIEVIQAGMDSTRSTQRSAPIALERTKVTGLLHKDGVVSMARGGPDSATDGFFICIGDQPELDFGGKRNADGQGFAAFGRVTNGMDVVRKIQHSPATGQRLTPPIGILEAKRVP